MFNKLISKFKKPKGEAAEKTEEKVLTVPQYGVFLRNKEGIPYFSSGVVDVYRDIPTAYATTKYLATNAAQVPLKFYYYKNDKPIEGDDEVAKLFRKPNREMSTSDLVESYASWYTLDGESFLYYKGGAPNAFPQAIQTPSPRLMKVDSLDKEGNILTWKFDNKIVMPELLITHIKSFNTTGIRGIGISTIGKTDMESDYYASQHQKKFFENSAIPEGLLELPLGTTPEEAEEIIELWNKHHRGTGNSSTIGALVGSKWVQTTVSNREAQFLETRRDLRDSILLNMLVNKAAMGVSEKVDRATAEVAERQVWRNNIRPMLLKLENRLNADFFPLFAPDKYCKFDFSGIEALHQNRLEQSDLAAKSLAGGLATLKQLRVMYPAVVPEPMSDDAYADVRMIPTSLIPINEDTTIIEEPTAAAPEPVAEEEEPTKAVKKEIKSRISAGRVARAHQKITRKHEKVMKSKLKKYMFEQRKDILAMLNGRKEIKSTTITTDIAGFMVDQNKKLQKTMAPLYVSGAKDGAKLASTVVGKEGSGNISNVIIKNRLKYITSVNSTIKEELLKEVNAGVQAGETVAQIEQRIKQYYNNATSYKTKRTAMTESAHIVSAQSHETYKEEGAKYKSIVTAGDDNVRETHTANEAAGRIPIDEPFPGTGEMFACESEVNCRCCMIGEI